jgi:hypothetical protein
MKKLLALICALIIIGCDVGSVNDPLNVRGMWSPNPPDQGVTHYDVWWWQDDDTTNFSIPVMAFYGSVTDTIVDKVITYNYVRLGVRAVNAQGVSDIGLSRFYSYFEFTAPSRPENVRVVQ